VRSWSPNVLAAAVTLVVLTVAYGFTPAVSRAVDPHDAPLFQNFHERETFRGVHYRWSKGGHRRPERASTIVLAQVGQGAGVLELQVWTAEDQPPIPLTVAADGQALLTVPVHGRQTVSAPLPRHVLGGGDLMVNLGAPGWTRRKDPRVRGVALERVTWKPYGWTLPPTRQIGLLPALAIAVAVLLRRLGSSPRRAAYVASAVGAVLALAAAARPLEVAPYTHRLLFMLVLAHGALVLWAALLRSGTNPWWALPREVGAAELLLLLGIGYWTILLQHLALCAETGTLCPTETARAVGLAVIIGLLALVPISAPGRRLHLALSLVALGGLGEAIGAATAAFHRPGVDFVTLWTAAHDLSLGGSLYRVDAVLANHFGTVFKVPPFYGMLLLPLAKTDIHSALLLHRTLDMALYAGVAGLLGALGAKRLGSPLSLAAVCTVMGLMQPPFDTVAYGQIDVVLLLLLTMAFLALQRGWPLVAGLAVALATLLKLYPLLLLALLLARREWRAIAWTVTWLLLLTSLAVAVVGWPEHVTYATQVLPRIGGGTGWIENQTINGFLCRLLTGSLAPEPVRERVVDLLTYLSLGLALAVGMALAARPSHRSSRYALQFGLFPLLMVLAVPAAWMHYETIVILPLVALVWNAAAERFSPPEAFVGALGFGLVAYGNQWSFFDGTSGPGLPLLALSHKLYGLLILFGLTSARILRSPQGIQLTGGSHRSMIAAEEGVPAAR